MARPSCFEGMFPVAMKLRRVTSVTDAGTETLQTVVIDFKAYLEVQEATITRPGGTGLAATTRIFTTTELLTDDRVWQPFDDDTSEDFSRSPHKIRELRDENGAISHYEAEI